MVYTVTFNPSLDHIVEVDDFRTGITNRVTAEEMRPGGKGINVSIVLKELGIESSAIYYSAGFVGDEITRLITESGINASEIKLSRGCSRINLKLKSIDGTEINGMGPDIDEDSINKLYDKLGDLKDGDILVLAGSIPPTMPKTIYSDIMERLKGRDIRIVVDATGELLLNVLEFKPFLIKPNDQELGELFRVDITTKESVIPFARKLREIGAENVIVSMAGEGAVLIDKDGNVTMLDAPLGKLINAVGAGDSMVAGFIAGIIKTGNPKEAFKLGIAAGSATAFSEWLAEGNSITGLYDAM